MNWPLAIERNRAALVAVAAAVAALLGGGDGPVARSLRNAALALLRPAEAAARRLIVMAARGLKARLRPPRPIPSGLAAVGRASGSRPPAFPLFDRPKRYRPAGVILRPEPRAIPRIRTFWTPASTQPLVPPSAISIGSASAQPAVGAADRPAQPAPAPKPARPDPEALVEAARLRLRLQALQAALADLPRQARRLARLRARIQLRLEARRASAPKDGLWIAPRQPMRIGRPPGWRLRPGRAVDLVLRECHALAMDAVRPAALAADTS
jgi:hypothetical protein